MKYSPRHRGYSSEKQRQGHKAKIQREHEASLRQAYGSLPFAAKYSGRCNLSGLRFPREEKVVYFRHYGLCLRVVADELLRWEHIDKAQKANTWCYICFRADRHTINGVCDFCLEQAEKDGAESFVYKADRERVTAALSEKKD